jgi:hypothetical protein
MRYEVRRFLQNSSASSLLSPETFATIAAASDGLPSVLFIEEQFDLLIANYMELENDLLSMATSVMVVRPDIPSIQRERNFIVNRRLLNLLSACRGYLDQTPHRLNALGHKDGSLVNASDFKSYASFEYDASLGYRVMEAMRNYTQHVGFPIEVRYNRGWIGEGEHKKDRFAVMPYIDVGLLENSFKTEVQQELQKLGDKVGIMPMVRQYVASLGNIHDRVRKSLADHVASWEDAVLEAIRKFKTDNPKEQPSSLVAVGISGKDWEHITLLSPLERQIEYRRALAKRNGGLTTLALRYVTNESNET